MAAHFQSQNIRSDKWLSGLVDAMEDISAAEDVCRAANPASIGLLLERLRHGRPAAVKREFSSVA